MEPKHHFVGNFLMGGFLSPANCYQNRPETFHLSFLCVFTSCNFTHWCNFFNSLCFRSTFLGQMIPFLNGGRQWVYPCKKMHQHPSCYVHKCLSAGMVKPVEGLEMINLPLPWNHTEGEKSLPMMIFFNISGSCNPSTIKFVFIVRKNFMKWSCIYLSALLLCYGKAAKLQQVIWKEPAIGSDGPTTQITRQLGMSCPFVTNW